MKNKKKCREQILAFGSGDFCGDFVQPIILKEDRCLGLRCARCRLIQAMWLEDEYEEPEVDWSKIEVDTPIEVSNDCKKWYKRHFAEYVYGKVRTWDDGATSWSDENDGETVDWYYARLPKEEVK